MNKLNSLILLGALAVTLTPLSLGQEPPENYRPDEYNYTLNNTEDSSAICGDGKCSSLEKGICAQDCNTNRNRTTNKEKMITNIEPHFVYGTSAIIIILTSTSYLFARKRRK